MRCQLTASRSLAVVLCVLVGPAWSQQGFDQEPPPVLDTTEVLAPFPRNPLSGRAVISSTRTEIPRGQDGSSVTVITGEQLRSSGQGLLHEALRGVPGLNVVRAGSPGQQTSVFIRGAESRHTKVLLDGIPLNDPSSPSRAFDFSNLTVDNIERIEVLRGPQSTLYGSDAIGGVINIITRRGEGPTKYRFSTLGGRYGTFRQSANVSGGTDRVYYSLGGSYVDSDGFTTAAPRLGNSEKDGFRNGNLSGRFGWLASDTTDVDVVVRYTDAEAQIDGYQFPVGPVDDLLRKLKNETFAFRTQLRTESFDGLIEQKFGFSYAHFNRRDTNAGFFGTPVFDGSTSKFDWQANVVLYETEVIRSVLTSGLDYLDEGASSSASARQSLHATGFYVQQHLVLDDRWSTVAGARWDRYSLAGPAKTYRVTSRYTADESGTAFHGSIGTGFRAPAINELFDPNLGNLDLKPERSFGWELGVEQSLADGDLVIDATYFRNDIDNLIVYQFDGTGPFGGHLYNVDEALTAGVEVTANLRVSEATSATFGYTSLDARNRTTGSRLMRRPSNTYRIGLDHRFADEGVSVGLNYQWVDRRDDFDGGGFVTSVDEYSLLNATVRWDYTDRLQLFARLDNITDETYEEVWGFATPRFGIYAGVTILLGGDD